LVFRMAATKKTAMNKNMSVGSVEQTPFVQPSAPPLATSKAKKSRLQQNPRRTVFAEVFFLLRKSDLWKGLNLTDQKLFVVMGNELGVIKSKASPSSFSLFLNGSKDIGTHQLQAFLLGLRELNSDVFIEYNRIFNELIWTWKPEDGNAVNRKAQKKMDDLPTSIAQLLVEFIEREGFSQAEFENLFTQLNLPISLSRIRAFQSGEAIPDDMGLGLLSIVVRKPGESEYSMLRESYTNSEFLMMRDGRLPHPASAIDKKTNQPDKEAPNGNGRSHQ